MVQDLIDKIRAVFEGDAGVRRVADDPILSAELLLLFRMVLADGVIDDAEMDALKRICSNAFGIAESSMDGVIEYLNEYGYETNGEQALEVFLDLPLARRAELAQHMAAIAKSDSSLAESEVRLLKRSLQFLGLKAEDLRSAPAI